MWSEQDQIWRWLLPLAQWWRVSPDTQSWAVWTQLEMVATPAELALIHHRSLSLGVEWHQDQLLSLLVSILTKFYGCLLCYWVDSAILNDSFYHWELHPLLPGEQLALWAKLNSAKFLCQCKIWALSEIFIQQNFCTIRYYDKVYSYLSCCFVRGSKAWPGTAAQ